MFAKNPRNGLRNRQHFLRRKKFVEYLGLVRNRTKPPADNEPKALLNFTVDDARYRRVAQIVHRRQTAGMLGASAERRFEFAAKVLCIRVAKQERRQCPRVRSDVKWLVRTNSHVGTAGHVSHRVATGLASRNSRSR